MVGCPRVLMKSQGCVSSASRNGSPTLNWTYLHSVEPLQGFLTGFTASLLSIISGKRGRGEEDEVADEQLDTLIMSEASGQLCNPAGKFCTRYWGLRGTLPCLSLPLRDISDCPLISQLQLPL